MDFAGLLAADAALPVDAGERKMPWPRVDLASSSASRVPLLPSAPRPAPVTELCPRVQWLPDRQQQRALLFSEERQWLCSFSNFSQICM